MSEGGVIPVSGYERGDGIKVGEYQRALPGTKRPAPEEEKKQDPSVPVVKGKEGEEPKKETPKGEPPAKKVSLTVQELLELDYKEHQAFLIAKSVADDAEKAALVAKDAAANKAKNEQDALDTAEHALPVPTKPGKVEFLEALEMALLQGEGIANLTESVILNTRAGHYDTDGGLYGLRSLVPHLQSAGLWKLAKEAAERKYAF